MPKKNPAVDQYIAQAPEYAQPILKRLRSAFHKGCPKLEETIKWGIPTFEYHGIIGSIAAFKKHVSVGFWKSKEMKDPENILDRRAASMSNIKFANTKDLPTVATLATYVKQAAELNAKSQDSPKKKVKKLTVPAIPEILKVALAKSKKAQATFKALSPSNQRDYIEWIVEAKREETKKRRTAQAIEWLKEGKSRNWKYEPGASSKSRAKKSKK